MERIATTSTDVALDNIERLIQLFPTVATESTDDQGHMHTAIDFDALRELIGDTVDGQRERYQFNWPGKRASKEEARRIVDKTMRPCTDLSVDWDSTGNLYIEGDSLDALKLMRNTYAGTVKLIYIDPPYNTGHDFIYVDDFSKTRAEFDSENGDYDDEGGRLVANLESNGRFHSDWCSMMYPRLLLARDLLASDGAILVSIDDNEQANLKKMLDEVFGQVNFQGIFVVNSTPNARDYGHIGKMHEYCLFYAKDASQLETYMLPDTDKRFKYSDSISGFNIHPLYNSNEAFHKGNRPNLYYPFYVDPASATPEKFCTISLTPFEGAIAVYPPKSLKNGVQFVWRWGKEKSGKFLNQEIIAYEINPGEYRIVQKMRHGEKRIRSLLMDTKYSSRRGTAEVEDLLGSKCFPFPKPLALLDDFCSAMLGTNDIALDFFSGSATLAHSLMAINARDGGTRKYILVQLPERTDGEFTSICEIGEERIRRAGAKIVAEVEEANRQLKLGEQPKPIPDVGFRVLRIDSSNFNDTYATPGEYVQGQLDLFEDNVKPDRSDLDLLFQVLPTLRIPYSARIEEADVCGKRVFVVNGGRVPELVACFDTEVGADCIEEIAKMRPIYAVFRDASMADDATEANFEELFKTFSPDTVRKVI